MADSFTITCPSCRHEWQTLQVGRRARTCPKCGHVGPREAFPERLTQAAASAKGDDDVARSKDAKASGSGDDAPAGARTNGQPKEVHRPLVGAALAAHEAKERGERVQVPARGSKGARRASDERDRGDRRSSSRTERPAGLLERVRRIW